MTAPASRWKLGLFVVAGTALGLGGVAYLGARELQRAAHSAFAYFDEALTGLEEGSPVKFRGVTIGVVERIRVAVDKKHLEVEASLYDDYLRDIGLDVEALDGVRPLPDGLRAQVVMSWVTSTAFVQVDYFPDPPEGVQQLPFVVPDHQITLRTVPSTAKSLEDAVRDVLGELPKVALSVRELVDLLRTELEASRLPDLSRQLQGLLTRLDGQLADVEKQGTLAVATRALADVGDAARALAGDDAPLAAALREWRELGADVRRTLDAAQVAATATSLRGASDEVAGLGAELRQSLQRDLVQLEAALAAVQRLAEMLERDPGALLHGRGARTSPLEERK